MLVKFVSIWSEVTTGRGEGGLRGRGVTCYVRLWIKHLCPEKFEDIFRILHCGLTWWTFINIFITMVTMIINTPSPSLCWSRLSDYLSISDHPLSPCFTRSTSSSSWWTRPSTSSSWCPSWSPWWSDHPSGVWQGWSGVLTRGLIILFNLINLFFKMANNIIKIFTMISVLIIRLVFGRADQEY